MDSLSLLPSCLIHMLTNATSFFVGSASFPVPWERCLGWCVLCCLTRSVRYHGSLLPLPVFPEAAFALRLSAFVNKHDAL